MQVCLVRMLITINSTSCMVVVLIVTGRSWLEAVCQNTNNGSVM